MPNLPDTSADDARVAAQIEADVGVEHIAVVYAQALVGAAQEAGMLDAALDEFDAVVRDVLDAHPKFEQLMASAMLSAEEKTAALERVFEGRASELMINFLKVVARHGRLDCLRAIHRSAGRLRDELRDRVPVEVTTAAPLDAASRRRLVETLREKLGREPLINPRVDPGLIGGAVIRLGDTVFDGSVANQLEILRQQMRSRSENEIQSRRNRFRDSAGN
jgi:F-type H+-transporting ATPase subunit delta